RDGGRVADRAVERLELPDGRAAQDSFDAQRVWRRRAGGERKSDEEQGADHSTSTASSSSALRSRALPITNGSAQSSVTTAGARFSGDQRYRYRLWRRWSPSPVIGLCMLKPFRADASRDGPT